MRFIIQHSLNQKRYVFMLGMITILIESEKKMSNYYLFVAVLTIMYAKDNMH